MYRSAFEPMKNWLAGSDRKPLIIRGARQVGKTWLMKEFGARCFERTIYVNMERNPRMASLFAGSKDLDSILLGLQIESGTSFVPGRTLLVFDEIQEVPSALTSLKYFNENAPQIPVIAAGSILGVAVNRDTSFPVGKVEFLDLHPLSFPEFLTAMGKQRLCEALADLRFDTVGAFTGQLIELLKQYFFVGGMPEAVSSFARSGDMKRVRKIQRDLLIAYEHDFSKHAPSAAVPRIRSVWESLPGQLARENRKFVFGLIREGARAREYETAIEWLTGCGLVHKVCRVTKPGVPLFAYLDSGAFKLYALDIGLLGASSRLEPETLLDGNALFTEFKGALAEQFVHQQLVSHAGLKPCYWSRTKGSAEVDFLVELGGDVLPLEVKASENLQAKSLVSYRDRYKPRISLRTSLSPYREESWLRNIPLYAVHMIREIAGKS